MRARPTLKPQMDSGRPLSHLLPIKHDSRALSSSRLRLLVSTSTHGQVNRAYLHSNIETNRDVQLEPNESTKS